MGEKGIMQYLKSYKRYNRSNTIPIIIIFLISSIYFYPLKKYANSSQKKTVLGPILTT